SNEQGAVGFDGLAGFLGDQVGVDVGACHGAGGGGIADLGGEVGDVSGGPDAGGFGAAGGVGGGVGARARGGGGRGGSPSGGVSPKSVRKAGRAFMWVGAARISRGMTVPSVRRTPDRWSAVTSTEAISPGTTRIPLAASCSDSSSVGGVLVWAK